MFPAYSYILLFFYIWEYKNTYITAPLLPYILNTKGVFPVRRKKGLVIDRSDICYEEECEEICFESPDNIKGNLIQGFSFTDEPVNFAPVAATKTTTEKPKV